MRLISSPLAVLAFSVSALSGVVVSAPAVAAAPAVQPFDQAAFDAAQKAGKPILIWVHAPWCPVCRQQAKTIARVTAQPAYRNMQVFRIDYDTQKDLWKKFGATMQSTVIGFHGKRETGRIAHETDDAKVAAVISSAIA